MDASDEDLSNQGTIATPTSAGGQGSTSRRNQRAAPDSEPTPSASSSAATHLSQSQLSKRRRGIGVVTPNACNECRKKRVKVGSHTSVPASMNVPC